MQTVKNKVTTQESINTLTSFLKLSYSKCNKAPIPAFLFLQKERKKNKVGCSLTRKKIRRA